MQDLAMCKGCGLYIPAESAHSPDNCAWGLGIKVRTLEVTVKNLENDKTSLKNENLRLAEKIGEEKKAGIDYRRNVLNNLANPIWVDVLSAYPALQGVDYAQNVRLELIMGLINDLSGLANMDDTAYRQNLIEILAILFGAVEHLDNAKNNRIGEIVYAQKLQDAQKGGK